MAKDVCSGILFIHSSESLVHRYELNPHNIVVSEYLPHPLFFFMINKQKIFLRFSD